MIIIIGKNWGMQDWELFALLYCYKAALAGGTLVQVNPWYTSQLCSGCGTIVEKDLGER